MKQLIILFLLFVSLFFNVLFLMHAWRSQIVVSVPDGDSLQLMDGRRVRLLGIDAPEKGRCLAHEARGELSALALGKRVGLKDMVTDDYGRTLAHIFIGRSLIQNDLVRNGLVRSESSLFEEASRYAKANKLGIYSETCRKTIAPEGCRIKGNIREGKPVYYVPTCKYYDQVIVDEAFGDAWFCSEREAKAGGFVRAPSC